MNANTTVTTNAISPEEAGSRARFAAPAREAVERIAQRPALFMAF